MLKTELEKRRWVLKQVGILSDLDNTLGSGCFSTTISSSFADLCRVYLLGGEIKEGAFCINYFFKDFIPSLEAFSQSRIEKVELVLLVMERILSSKLERTQRFSVVQRTAK